MVRNLLLIAVVSFGTSITFAGEAQDKKGPVYATLKTSMGDIVIQLFEDKAPKTVANFVDLASGTKEWTDPKTGAKVKRPLYNGTIFHRVIADFMVQGGGFTADLTAKKTRDPIKHEGGNGLRNQVGTIAMARTREPNSATSQFFINVVDNQMLDFRGPNADEIGYCVFGRVIKGLDVVNKIRGVETTARGPHQNVPVQTVTIEKVTVIEAKPAAKSK